MKINKSHYVLGGVVIVLLILVTILSINFFNNKAQFETCKKDLLTAKTTQAYYFKLACAQNDVIYWTDKLLALYRPISPSYNYNFARQCVDAGLADKVYN